MFPIKELISALTFS